MRGQLQDMKKASSEGCALMHDSPNRRCFTATGVIHEFNKAEIMSPISSRVHLEIVPISKVPPAGPRKVIANHR